jgi:hypothetical protein
MADIVRILTELREEQELLAMAIQALERLAQNAPKRRGRPPAWLAEAGDKPQRRPRAGSNIQPRE